MSQWAVSVVLGVLLAVLVGWETGLIHRRDPVGVVLQVLVVVVCIGLARL